MILNNGKAMEQWECSYLSVGCKATQENCSMLSSKYEYNHALSLADYLLRVYSVGMDTRISAIALFITAWSRSNLNVLSQWW